MENNSNISKIESIEVIGLGSSGVKAVDTMIREGISGAEFLAIDTDLQVLEQSQANVRLQIGEWQCSGFGTSGNPRLGQQAAKEAEELFSKTLAEVDLAFIVTGLGGGTGSGASQVLAEMLRKQATKCIAIVARPFEFEGERRGKLASQALDKLERVVDAMIIVNMHVAMDFIHVQSFSDATVEINKMMLQVVRGLSRRMRQPENELVDLQQIQELVPEQWLHTGLMEVFLANDQNSDLQEQNQADTLSSVLKNTNHISYVKHLCEDSISRPPMPSFESPFDEKELEVPTLWRRHGKTFNIPKPLPYSQNNKQNSEKPLSEKELDVPTFWRKYAKTDSQ